MDRGGGENPLETVRVSLGALTFLQLLMVIVMISDELQWRFRSFRWQEVPVDATPPREDPVEREGAEEPNDGSTVSGSEEPPMRGPRQPDGPPPGWQAPPWKRQRRG